MAKKPKTPQWIIGVDEVGRGPLAGPVHVCAAAMRVEFYRRMKWKKEGVIIGDSKKMTAVGREVWEREARSLVKAQKARIAVVSMNVGLIDRKGIAVCIRASIARAIARLEISERDCAVLLDGGLKAPKGYVRQQTVIRGDDVHKIISLASVVAKVRRDRYMKKAHFLHPQYGWDVNKGYGTKTHRGAIRHYGPCPLHRKSFISKVI